MPVSTANVGDLAYRVVGNQKRTVTDVTFDNSYPTGGESVTPSQLGLNRVEFATCTIKVPGGTATAAADYDVTNQKIIVYNTTAQVANTTDLSALVVRVVAFGH